ncbi:MAG: hypothetical protein AAF658_11915, partial [Myxococcota bacterium]
MVPLVAILTLGASEVSLEAAPDRVVLQGKDAADVTLLLRVAESSQGTPILHTSAGRLGPVESLGAGRYRATLHRPRESYPQLAV